MKNLKLINLLSGLTLLLAGCGSPTWNIIKIPRTPENLQAYRECQRTWALATGYSTEGFLRLKDQCVMTIPNITILNNLSKEEFHKAISEERCNEIDKGNYYEYYFCEPK